MWHGWQILVGAILFAAASPQTSNADSTGWTWGLAEENPDIGSGAKLASTVERNGKGYPLVLLECHNETIKFVDGPEDGFWIDQSVGIASAQIGYVNFDANGQRFVFPYVAEPGMDGYYSTFDLGGTLGMLKYAEQFSLCPTENASAERCRTFSLLNFESALNFICSK